MKKINIGIVGLGRLGKEYAKNIAYVVNNANLVAACSLREDELNFAKDCLNIPNLYTSYKEMLTNKEMEAVVIVTSTDQHADQIIKAVEAGYHVFCEKPLAIDLEDCYRVEEIVNKYPDRITMLRFCKKVRPKLCRCKTKTGSGFGR